jgi:hypothetical protein
VNYALQSIGASPSSSSQTFGALDMGGASTQITFSPNLGQTDVLANGLLRSFFAGSAL